MSRTRAERRRWHRLRRRREQQLASVRGWGREYWSARYPYPLVPGRWAKTRTHRYERRRARREVEEQLEEEMA